MRWLIAPLFMFCAGCFRAPSVPSLPDGSGGRAKELLNPSGSAGEYLVTYGYYTMGLGIIALIVGAALLAFRLGYHKSSLMLGACLIGLGASLVYIGPWLAWIFAAAAIVIVAVLSLIIVRNFAMWVGWVERNTHLDIDGIPNADQYPSSTEHATIKKNADR